jgi:hypothetical protein
LLPSEQPEISVAGNLKSVATESYLTEADELSVEAICVCAAPAFGLCDRLASLEGGRIVERPIGSSGRQTPASSRTRKASDHRVSANGYIAPKSVRAGAFRRSPVGPIPDRQL